MEVLKHLTVTQVFNIVTAAERAHAVAIRQEDAGDNTGPTDLLPNALDIARTGRWVESEERALVTMLIEDMTAGARQELAALFWWGRGPEFASFDDAVRHARNSDADPDYLAGKANLVRCLQHGIFKLRHIDLFEPQREDAG